MHAVILTNFATPKGGAEKVAIESARGLAERGVAVTLVHGVDGPADPLLDHPSIRRVSLGLTDVWERPAWRGAIEGIWSREAARRLDAALAALPDRPDVLHLHQWTRSLSPAVFSVLARQHAPVAVTLHDYFLACPNGVYYRFDTAEPCSLRPFSPGCLAASCDPQSRAHKAVRLVRGFVQLAAIFRGFGRRPLALVHVSDGSRARLEPMLAGGPFFHHRIDNPVRVARAAPADPAGGDAVAFVGRSPARRGPTSWRRPPTGPGCHRCSSATGRSPTSCAAVPAPRWSAGAHPRRSRRCCAPGPAPWRPRRAGSRPGR